MKIASIQPLSLSDFPPYCAAIIFTVGCNLRCDYCHNKTLWDNNHQPVDPKEVFSFLENKKNVLDGIVITGGEPTIHNGLYDFVEKIKNLGYKIKLNTNGINTEALKKLIKNKLLDYIAMDIKNSAHIYKKEHIENIKKSAELISASDIQHEFRTIQDPALPENYDINFVMDILPKNSKHIVCAKN